MAGISSAGAQQQGAKRKPIDWRVQQLCPYLNAAHCSKASSLLSGNEFADHFLLFGMVTPPGRSRSVERPLDNTHHSRTEVQVDDAGRHSVNCLLGILRAVRMNDPNVQRVVIEDRILPPLYLQSLLSAVANNKFVTHLRLVKVGMDRFHASNMAACLQKAPALVLVDWSKNKIDDECCKEVAAALEARGKSNSSVLRKLSLESNSISDDGLSYLLNAIKEVSTLTTLKLGRQPYSESGVHEICNFLIDNQSSVSRLDLRGITLSTKGAELLSKALERNSTIERLVLARNNFDSGGAIALAQSLTTNRILKTLDLQRNKVDDESAEAFVKMLETNHTFGKVKIRNTLVSEEAKQKLLDFLVMNAHGPELAQRTKLAFAKLAKAEESRRSGSLGQSHHECVPGLIGLDDSERSDNSVSDEDYIYAVEEEACVICCDPLHIKPSIILPCGHKNACGHCCAKLQSCHMCRSPIVFVFGMSAPPTKKPRETKSASKDATDARSRAHVR